MASHLVDPDLVDATGAALKSLSSVAVHRLRSSWHLLFRKALLNLMPAQALAEHFHPTFGRPTKELYSVAGLILIKEFMNWTNEKAADAYMFDRSIQVALNLSPDSQSMSERTIDRYCKLFREDELATKVMNDLTAKLVELLDLDVSQQRLDSTHVSSNMAVFGRTRLMGVAIKGFLEYLHKQSSRLYGRLPEHLRERYKPSRNQLFGGWRKDDDWTKHRLDVAQDMYLLVTRFDNHKVLSKSKSFQMMKLVFTQQCDVKEDKVEVKKAPGGNIVTNPSDPDATLDGHKGSGYQVQISETCSPNNDVQLVVAVIAEQAHQSDSDALPAVLSDLNERGLLPKEMLADTAYGGDDNFCHCKRYGVDLVAPVPGTESEAKTSGDVFRETDFMIEEREVVDGYGVKHVNPFIVSCPAGIEPYCSHYDHVSGKMEILNFPETCADCPLRSKCPVRFANGWMIVTIHAKPMRLSQRRKEQQTEDFKSRYRIRSGIEATNSMLKRVTGLGRLRVRGKASVFMSTLLKIAGWNVLRASHSKALMHALLGVLTYLSLLWSCMQASRKPMHA